MKRREFIQHTTLTGVGLSVTPTLMNNLNDKPIRIGMIGLDTSHCTAFTNILNDPEAAPDVAGFRVTHAYPHGSADIESSVSRIPKYTQEAQELGVTITSSIGDMLKEVDVVLLETNDGRLHLEQALEVLAAGKPVFIDKPIAASLSHAIQIFEVAEKAQVPIFSASSLRFAPTTQQVIHEKPVGNVLGAETYSPAKLEPTHPDLFWYGVHGVEALITLMGTGCEQVQRIYTPESEVVIGYWNDGRIGTFRGLRNGKTGYGGRVYGESGIMEAGGYEGYRPLVVEIGKFFRSGKPPVSAQETLEIFAFMEAAHVSSQRDGVPVRLDEVMDMARKK